MADLHDVFMNYNQAIRLSDDDRENLKIARESLRTRMKEAFLKLPEKERKTHSIEFQSQGSFVMDTIIKPDVNDFDLDDGVYFQGSLTEAERADTKIFHDIIIKAIDKNNEIEEITDKPTCVRVKYKNKYEERELGFHIDLPIYYAEGLETPELAHTDDGWIESSPVEFIVWFEEKAKSGFQKAFIVEALNYAKPYEKWLTDIRKEDSQLRRIVRYLKSWADLSRNEMPCGIIMSILAANNYKENEKDDIALRDTLISINKDLDDNRFQCLRPTPKTGENLFDNSSKEEKAYFKTQLLAFIESAKQAVEKESKKEACAKWQKHLGHRFPCSMITETEEELAMAFPFVDVIKHDQKNAI
jgi:hypothetical protein